MIFTITKIQNVASVIEHIYDFYNSRWFTYRWPQDRISHWSLLFPFERKDFKVEGKIHNPGSLIWTLNTRFCISLSHLYLKGSPELRSISDRAVSTFLSHWALSAHLEGFSRGAWFLFVPWPNGYSHVRKVTSGGRHCSLRDGEEGRGPGWPRRSGWINLVSVAADGQLAPHIPTWGWGGEAGHCTHWGGGSQSFFQTKSSSVLPRNKTLSVLLYVQKEWLFEAWIQKLHGTGQMKVIKMKPWKKKRSLVYFLFQSIRQLYCIFI